MSKDQASKEQFEKLGNDAVEYVPPEVISEEDLINAAGGETGEPYGFVVMMPNANFIANANAVANANANADVNYMANMNASYNTNTNA